MESVALRLITGLGNSEVMPSLTRYTFCSDTKPTLISTDSEELNRVLVLTMARAIHVTVPVCLLEEYGKHCSASIH
ncbi:Mediator of RNA polymerase II transcription subunit 23 [Portunus trituberculatus]|uniref:Mediator of RNA polymerase II transcription subunit 23 n=1 Tax=Portunus trituberculatus TaxID=210409 RepID=A0A5B7DD90_PORTR|nr:Mediator of RNA polymerase II transcription subunit 23 [Portunus trituberculatus]